MEHDGGLSLVEYARLFYQESSLVTQLRQNSAKLELRIHGLHQAQHAIAGLEKERDHLTKLTSGIESSGSTSLDTSDATFSRSLNQSLEHFESRWEASMKQAHSSNSGSESNLKSWLSGLKEKGAVLNSLQEGLGNHKLLAKQILRRPESMALILALVHASQDESSVLALSEEVALLAFSESETLLFTLLDILHNQGSYISESISKETTTCDPLSATHLVELELLEYLQSDLAVEALPSTPSRRTSSHRNFSTPDSRIRKASSPAPSFSSTLSSMTSSAAQLWTTATTTIPALASPSSPPLTPAYSLDDDISVHFHADTQATASFSHDTLHASDILSRIASNSPRKRTVSLSSKSEIRLISPTKTAFISERQSPNIQRASSRILAALFSVEQSKTARRFPIAMALCRRLLLHHFPALTHPVEHKRLSVLLVVRWFAFSRLSALINRPDNFNRSLAGCNYAWAFGSLQFGQRSTFARANVDLQTSCIMQGVRITGHEVSLGELHRCMYSTIIQAVDGVRNEATDLVSIFGVGSQNTFASIAKVEEQCLISTLSLRYRDVRELWELLGKGDLQGEESGEHIDDDSLEVIYAINGRKEGASLRLFYTMDSALDHVVDRRKETSTTRSTLSHIPPSVTSSSGWSSPLRSPFHQAMDAENSYFGEAHMKRASLGSGDDEVLGRGIDAMIAKGYIGSVINENDTTLISVLEDARRKARECFAFENAALFASILARISSENIDCCELLKRHSLPRLERVESMRRKRERISDHLEEVEHHRIILIERARLVYERLQELRVRVWYVTEIRTSAGVVHMKEAAQRSIDGSDQLECAEWMQSSGIYNFEAGQRLTSYLKTLDPAFQKIAGDAKSFFRSPIWKREWAVARPFLQGDDSKEKEPVSVAILTFGVCSLGLLRPDDHPSNILVSLEAFLQRVQLLCTGLFLSEALQGVDLGDEEKIKGGDSNSQYIVEGLKGEGVIELLRRFRLHPSPRVKMQSILTLERLIIARLERPEILQRPPSLRTENASHKDAMSIASFQKPRRALSMYEDEVMPFNLHDALLSQEKARGEKGGEDEEGECGGEGERDDSDAITITSVPKGEVSVPHPPTTDDVVTILEELLRDDEVRPKNLYASLQIIAAFSPLQVLDFKDEGKAFWDLALASLSLRKEAAAAAAAAVEEDGG